MQREESWIQCDSCFHWRRGVDTAPFTNGLCQRWFCQDAGRTCSEPCDYCHVRSCLCTPSQSYCGYATSGYSLPQGFSVLIRFRHAEDAEVGKPWLTYRSWCDVCGKKSRGVDRRDYMEKWLVQHKEHNPKWEQLTVAAFDFRVDSRTRELYAMYMRLVRRGVMEGGIREVVRKGSVMITSEEMEALKLLLEMVEASRFFDEKMIMSAKAHSRKRSAARSSLEEVGGKISLEMLSSRKRSKRKSKPPEWMMSDAQWIVNDPLTECQLDLPVPSLRRQSEIKSDGRMETGAFRATDPLDRTAFRETDPLTIAGFQSTEPLATPISRAAEPSSATPSHATDQLQTGAFRMEPPDSAMTERLLSGSVTKRKDKQSLVFEPNVPQIPDHPPDTQYPNGAFTEHRCEGLDGGVESGRSLSSGLGAALFDPCELQHRCEGSLTGASSLSQVNGSGTIDFSTISDLGAGFPFDGEPPLTELPSPSLSSNSPNEDV